VAGNLHFFSDRIVSGHGLIRVRFV
jgi:hypothetical protein